MTAVEHRAPLSGPALAAALSPPEAYCDGSVPVEVRETPTSWVFLVGDGAYRLKKPVRMPFVDCGTAERRHDMCREEVRLNRRLAPRLYPGVMAVIAVPGGVALAPVHHPTPSTT